MASGIGGVNTLLTNYDALKEKGPRRVSPLAVPMLMPNAPAANISLYVGARAAVNTPVSACASGNEAIALAVDQIRLGRADIVLAGGTEAAIHPLPMAAFAQHDGAVEEPRRPEPRSRGRGTPAATGSCSARARACWCSSPRSTHEARGARIYAEVLGAGITADSHDIAQPDPAGRGGSRAILRALEESEISAERHRPRQRPRDLDPAGRHRRGPDAARDAR